MGEDSSCILPSFASESVCMPDFNSISRNNWEATEVAIRDILNRISPTDVAQDKRRKIISYMQRLVYNTVGVQVFPYGSVPLKTYLPDGDIDLTAISVPGQEEQMAEDVFKLLSAESTNINAEFDIKEVNMINAKVKIVKCIVGGIIMDVSFNQLGGLCSLCFLEKIDRKIAQDHLFKRSIMLIKAWCYYENRVLGAMYTLMSTYALEILVLYIFNMYLESLTTPLMVLYRFLQYYSTFDWDKLCITLDGPASVSSLPNIIVDNPICDSVFSREFLKMCQEMYNVPSNGQFEFFERKPLNIVDPLNNSNNLGRSVSPVNSYRIKNVFKLGARELGEIMELPTDKIKAAVADFFKKTLEMNQSRCNPLSRIPLDDLSTYPYMVVVDWNLDLEYKSDIDDSNHSNSETNDGGPTKGWCCSRRKVVPTPENVNVVNKPEKKLMIFLKGNEPYKLSAKRACYYQMWMKKIKDEMNDLCKENKDLDLWEFAGDYDGYVRNLVYGLNYYCFSSPSRLFDVPDQPTPYGGYWQHEVGCSLTGPWVPQNQAWVQQYPNVEPMQHGMHLFDHEFGMQSTIDPTMGSPARGRGRGWGQPTTRRQLHRGYEGTGPALDANHEGQNPRDLCPTSPVHSGAHIPEQGSSQRRLQFGSFGALPNTSQNVDISDPERAEAERLKLKDVEEFPPLSG